MAGRTIFLYIGKNYCCENCLAPQTQNKLWRAISRTGCAWNPETLRVHKLRDDPERICASFQVFDNTTEFPGFETCVDFAKIIY